MDELNIQLMSAWLASRIRSYGPEYVVRFVDCDKSALHIYNNSLGRELRAAFNLWDAPDALSASQTVINETHKALQ